MTELRRRSLLVCSASLPHPDGDSASRRLFHFVDFLRAAGCGVTCAARSAPVVADSGAPLTDIGAKVVVDHDHDLERLAQNEFFDWALLGSWSVAEPLLEPLRTASPATRIVIDVRDVHFLRHARRIRREVGDRLHWPRQLGDDYAWNTVRELDAYAAADGVLTASRKDADLVADLLGDRRRIFTVPDSEDLPASPFPFARRRGLFYVGDFAHQHNFDALARLCDEILPHVDPAVLADHPLSVAGRHMTDEIRGIAAGWPTVRMIGRVPSVVPYLERVRVALVPLPHGTGMKRTIIQALATGTPTVTTSAGIEGLPFTDEREVLVADDPVRFAAGITRLLTDEPLWNELARVGRERIRAEHGHDTARRLLAEALLAIRDVEPAARKPARARRMSNREYEASIRRARDAIERGTPPGAVVAVVSRGDEEAVTLDGRTGWHFPLGDDGDYAGYYPTTASEAIGHLEAVRERGAEYFAIPTPSAWWLGHYRDLRTHLECRYRVLETDGGLCALVSLRESPVGPQSLAAVTTGEDADAAPNADDRPPTIVFAGLSDRHVVTRSPPGPPPAISVVIPTRDRATLLAEVLESLARQTAESAAYEVVVVDDGSTDGSADVCRDLSRRLRLTLVQAPASGIAGARNLGVDAAAAPLVLFLDDDDVADPGLVAAHLAAHRRFPLEHVAALGSAAWHPRLPTTAVMRFIAASGRLHPGPPLHDGQLLDDTHFTGGRSSCKKSLLVRAGGFRRECTFGAEDVEAGHRIGRMLARERPRASAHAADVGLAVVPCRDAVQFTIRPVTFDEFCLRCERQGRAQRHFSRVAADRRVDDRLGVQGADERWRELRNALEVTVARVRELERDAGTAGPDREGLLERLHALYAWTFEAFRTKGLVEAAGDA